jgi:hypothetical protein
MYYWENKALAKNVFEKARSENVEGAKNSSVATVLRSAMRFY